MSGTDRYRLERATPAPRATSSYPGELLASDDSGYGNVYPHRLLARADELERVLAVIDESEKN